MGVDRVSSDQWREMSLADEAETDGGNGWGYCTLYTSKKKRLGWGSWALTGFPFFPFFIFNSLPADRVAKKLIKKRNSGSGRGPRPEKVGFSRCGFFFLHPESQVC